MSAAELINRLDVADERKPNGLDPQAAAEVVVEWLRDEASEYARVADEIATTRQAGNYYRAGAEVLERLSRELRTEVLRG